MLWNYKNDSGLFAALIVLSWQNYADNLHEVLIHWLCYHKLSARSLSFTKQNFRTNCMQLWCYSHVLWRGSVSY